VPLSAALIVLITIIGLVVYGGIAGYGIPYEIASPRLCLVNLVIEVVDPRSSTSLERPR